MPSEVAAFAVTLGCENCDDSWDREYPPGTNVVEDARVTSHSQDCDTMGTTGCDCCETIQCPTCGLYKDVTVEDRSPIEEEDHD